MYKLFAKESVDEDIFEMGERKSKLSKAVLQDDRAVAKADGTPAGTDGVSFFLCFCAANCVILLCCNTQFSGSHYIVHNCDLVL